MTCNPVDLAYRYQDASIPQHSRGVFREAADPSIVRYNDRYYMFASMSRGFWHTTDLATWTFAATDKLPILDYAPDVRVIDGALYISASRRDEGCPVFRSTDPLADDFAEVAVSAFPFWDPNLFQDDDGSVYFYWGCDNKEPLYGIRVDLDGFRQIGERAELINSDTETRGWEQPGENHVRQEPRTEMERIIAQHMGTRPFIEGAWMDRRDDTYYLQYSAPGTETNTYADGYATSSSPLGPFEYSPYSPFSSKPGGFITGAGHGSTFQDDFGNWWHAATMRVSIAHSFERRIGLFPAGFDDDGVLFCNQNFGDYPMVVPNGPIDPWTEASPGWMLMSRGSNATASSSLEDHGPALAVNEDIRTWWVAGDSAAGHWLQLDLGSAKDARAIQVNLADHDLAAFAPAVPDPAPKDHEVRGIYTDIQAPEYTLEVSTDGDSWATVADTREDGVDAPHKLVVLSEPTPVRYVRLTGYRMPFGAPLTVSGIRVFGVGGGEQPAEVSATVKRVDPLTAHLSWEPVAGADGYNVRYGIHPEKLYHSWMVYDADELTIRSLNAGQRYWFAVDAFNESGVTTGVTVADA
ncbi:family 43 glycosylhydrolase [Agreia bicolorata]|uniref:F5/8 type C domain-containing protein n=1 Tax=Agreia bicolorata TaxID=110935 RepID=A0ABR5CGE5_9MICO|nr:family 43 glycosylhydrolase [Agreia bicolorata]KJC64691.1 hypothetical protein TZ00_07040 [Agreia bicolorata]